MRYCCSFTHFSLAAFSTKGLINLITGLHLVSSPLTRDMKGATRKVSWFGKKTAWGHFSLFLTDNKHASSYLRLDSNALCEVNDSYDYACITLGAKSDSIFPFDLCFAPSGHFKGGIYTTSNSGQENFLYFNINNMNAAKLNPCSNHFVLSIFHFPASVSQYGSIVVKLLSTKYDKGPTALRWGFFFFFANHCTIWFIDLSHKT